MKTTYKLITALMLTFNFQLLTFNSNAQANQPGAGNALSFDGVSNWIQIINPTNLPIGNAPRTVEYWVFYQKDSCVMAIVSYGDGGAGLDAIQDFILLLTNYAGTHYIFTDDINGANNITVTNTQFPAPNVWSHIAFVTSGNNWSYFLNGILQTSGVFPITLNTGPPNQIAIGRRSSFALDAPPCSGGRGDYAFGQLDEVRIWNTALTQTQIRDNMCKKLIGNEAGLVGYWRFDETSGNTAFDSSPNGNNGTGF